MTIECRIGEGIGKTIQLFGVENGQKKILASASYAQNGYYGFSFIPEYEGFYVLGDGRNYEYPLYLKVGDAVSLFMDKDTVYLTGKHNTPENKVLYEWVNLSKRVCEKSIFFTRTHSIYRGISFRNSKFTFEDRTIPVRISRRRMCILTS